MGSRASTTVLVAALSGAVPALVAGCQRSGGAAAPPARQARDARAVRVEQPEFFVVAEGLEGMEVDRNELRLCDVNGAVLLCRPVLIFRNGRFDDLAEDPAFDPTGTWPDSLWALRSPRCLHETPPGAAWIRPDCPFGVEVMRWSSDRWQKAGFLELQAFRFTPHWIWEWPGGRSIGLASHQILDRKGEPRDDVDHLSVYGPRPHPALPRRTAAGGPGVSRVDPIDEREALVFRHRGSPEQPIDYVERWVDDRPVARVDLPKDFFELRSFAWRDITGVIDIQGEPPRGVRFDGQRWADFELPGWGDEARSYDREPNGTEWAVMDSGRKDYEYSPLETRLYRRRPGDAWRSVALPPPAFPTASGDHTIQPTDVRVTGPGDVWVRGRFRAGCDRGVVLHSARPTSVCFLEPNDRTCRSAPAARRTVTCRPGGELPR